MKVLAPYVKMHSETMASLRSYAPDAEWVDTSTNVFSYWRMLKAHWNKGDALMIVEQDIVITADVVSSFNGCSQSWCCYGYAGRSGPDTIIGMLGCTKFSVALQAAVNIEKDIYSADLCSAGADPKWADPVGIHWYGLDSWLNAGLRSKGYLVHDHGIVQHLHDYVKHPDAGTGAAENGQQKAPTEVGASASDLRSCACQKIHLVWCASTKESNGAELPFASTEICYSRIWSVCVKH
jgi:hypothetical protein